MKGPCGPLAAALVGCLLLVQICEFRVLGMHSRPSPHSQRSHRRQDAEHHGPARRHLRRTHTRRLRQQRRQASRRHKVTELTDAEGMPDLKFIYASSPNDPLPVSDIESGLDPSTSLEPSTSLKPSTSLDPPANLEAVAKMPAEVLGTEGTSMFTDVMQYSAPGEWKLLKNNVSHSANTVDYQYMAPQFVDINHDGRLDLVNPNHCSQCPRENMKDAVQRWSSDGGVTVDEARLLAGGIAVSAFNRTYCGSVWGWDLGIAQFSDEKDNNKTVKYRPVVVENDHVRLTDDMFHAFEESHVSATDDVTLEEIKDTQGRLWQADTHGFAVLDLDGDGRLDVMATIGANHGVGKSPHDRNFLLWGDGNDTHWRWTGGREEAIVAGVDSFMGRSRGITFFDADNDGVLDMYIANVAREDDLIVPSEMLVSHGRNRRWEHAVGNRFRWAPSKAGPLAQYSVKAVMADIDADGHMNELVQVLAPCPAASELVPQSPTPLVEPSLQWAVGQEQREFCASRPRGTVMVMKLDGAGSASVSKHHFRSIHDFKLGATSGDIDNDGILDLLVLQWTHVVAFVSGNLSPGQTLLDQDPVIVAEYGGEVIPVDFALADFDMDGDLDMVVVGQHPGSSHIYTNVGPEAGYFERDLGMFGMQANPYTAGDRPTAQGVTVADVDNDGFQDIFVAYNNASGMLMRNKLLEKYQQADLTPPRTVSFSLLGSVGNPTGIGATVVLHTTPLENNVTRQVRTVGVAQRSGGHDDPRIVFTLGRSEATMLKLTITWPSGFVQTVLPMKLKMALGSTVAKPLQLAERAGLAIAGGVRVCKKHHNGSITDAVALRFTLARMLALAPNAPRADGSRLQEITDLQARLANSTRGVRRHGIYLLRSTTRVPMPLFGDDMTLKLGGVPHMPKDSGAKVGTVSCTRGLTARSHLGGAESDHYSAMPVTPPLVKKLAAPNWRSYAFMENDFAREGLPDPCSDEAPQLVYYQFVDTTTCSLSPVFQYASRDCCRDVLRGFRQAK